MAGWLLTLLAVVVAWVLFRAETLAGAGRILASMTTVTIGQPVHTHLWNAGLSLPAGLVWCAALGALTALPHNSNRIGTLLRDACHNSTTKAALIAGASTAAVAFMLIMNITRDSVSAFIYFNF